MKKARKKLTLKKDMITSMSNHEIATVKGGFLSIGHTCSDRNKCERMNTSHWGNGCSTNSCNPHYSTEGTCPIE
ncbi:hypothetical protein [Fulvivirga imtechensis]|uniref:hypothetical protein n=1 Tax=Fulvivirga imtechensis TaxID=881893 RepID=UPI0012F982F5|nr:hypothetical protein [Fulvivirga imtechensis]